VIFAVNYALLSTASTALGRVRGFTITLLYLLFDGGGRCCDLAMLAHAHTELYILVEVDQFANCLKRLKNQLFPKELRVFQ
jgi:hypothetical protein